MTHDELRERIAAIVIDELRIDGGATRINPVQTADRIIALLPPTPKLEWRKNEFGDPDHWAYVGDLYVGQVHRYDPTKGYRSWFMFDDEGDKLGLHATIEEARAAVEAKVKEALGWL